MNTRRELLAAFAAAALVLPLSSVAQPATKVWRIGFLASRRRPVPSDLDFMGPFTQGMRELGYVEGKNLVIEWRFADGKPERLPLLVAELLNLKIDIMTTQGTPATSAAQKATTTLPIVMTSVGDPVGNGFVKSLAHPGGNITGLSNINVDIGPKRLEMLRTLMPGLSRVAVLLNPDNSSNPLFLKSIQLAARSINVKVLPVEVRNPQEIEKAFSAMTRGNTGSIIMAPDALFAQQVLQIARLAAKQQLPSIAAYGEYAEAGGLMGFGQNQSDRYRRAAIYVDKIFKGARPGDLPIEQPTNFELVVNMKTAKALGIRIPQSILVRADKVIE